MENLFQKFETLLYHTPTIAKRYLYDKISWGSRLIGILGPRGVGKTTMVLQYIKENLDKNKSLYVLADDFYFAEKRLYDLADLFYKSAGRNLFIDEIHKYPDWSRELKNIYDSFPDLKVVFTGSSVLDILKGTADLSRRAIIYILQGLSFREYLKFFHNISVPQFSLKSIVNNEAKIEGIQHPLPLFDHYLKSGYYPFGLENEMHLRLSQIIIQTLETDIPHYANLNVGTSRKLKRLLSIIAESVPFKPNFSKIAELIGVSRNALDDYFQFMEKAGLIGQLRTPTKGIRELGKINKVYLDNSNLIFNLSGSFFNSGNVRETFFFNQMRVNHQVFSSSHSDFSIDDFTFEIGGKSKSQKQIASIPNSYVVKDKIEYGYSNVVPLWAFGLNY